MTAETAITTVLTASAVTPEVFEDDEIIPLMLGYDPKEITLSAKKERLKALGFDTRKLMHRNIINAYLIGKNLLEARALCLDEEGFEVGYVEWLRENAGMSIVNSYAYRNLALNYRFYFESYLSVPEKVSALEKISLNTNVTALLYLAAPSVPDSARRESVAMLEAGEIVNPKEASKLIEKYKPPVDDKKQNNKISSKSESSGEANQNKPLFPEAWSKSDDFTITLANNSYVSVKFTSQIVDELTKCYHFEFRGDIADNGFRRHYAPYREANNYADPKEYAQSVCEQLHQKLQAKRSQTPYHEFKKGDRVEVIKGKYKGTKTKITELLTGKNRCIVTSNGEFSPAQLRKIEHDNVLENSSPPNTEDDQSSGQAQETYVNLASSASLQDGTATEKPELLEGLPNYQPLHLYECNSPDEATKFIKYSNPVKIWQEVLELQTTTKSLIAQKAHLEQKLLEMQAQLGQVQAS